MSYTPTEAQRAEWDNWVATRPEVIQALAARFQPWHEYRYRPTGQRAALRSFSEPSAEHPHGSLTCAMWQEWCPGLTARTVFGLDPDDFEPEPLPPSQPGDGERGNG